MKYSDLAGLGYELDAEAGALYIRLSDRPYAYGHDLDHARRVDFGFDGEPIGIELLYITDGVDLRDLPERDRVARLLEELQTRVHA